MSSISIIIYIVFTLSIGYAFIYSSFGDLSALLDEKQRYNESLEMVSNIENKKSELLTKFNEIPAADRKNIETILPSSLNFVKLISQINSVAANYGISIDKISSKEINSQNSYQSAIIGFSFTAPYDKFNAFIGDLEKSLRILDIRSARLSTQKDGVYSYNMEFETYWLKK